MTISITDLGGWGGAGNGSSSTAFASGSLTVPGGSLIFIAVAEASSGGNATCSDQAGNTYNLINTTGSGPSQSYIFYCTNCKALSAQTITVHNSSSGGDIDAQALSATNIGVFENFTSLASYGTPTPQTSVSLTSGTPAVAGELFIAYVTSKTQAASSPVQSSGGWATPPASGTKGTTAQIIIGGWQVNAGTGTETYNPSWTGSSNGDIGMAWFKPATPDMNSMGMFCLP